MLLEQCHISYCSNYSFSNGTTKFQEDKMTGTLLASWQWPKIRFYFNNNVEVRIINNLYGIFAKIYYVNSEGKYITKSITLFIVYAESCRQICFICVWSKHLNFAYSFALSKYFIIAESSHINLKLVPLC
jgi:hypothetical protein